MSGRHLALQRVLGTLADVILLNFLFLLGALPIVTAGVSCAAMQQVLLQVVRGEEGRVAGAFWHSYRQNLRQGVILGLPFLGLALLWCLDLYLLGTLQGRTARVLWLSFWLLPVAVLPLAVYAFAWLGHFESRTAEILRGALWLTLSSFPRSLLMGTACALPLWVLFWLPQLSPLLLFFGAALPGLICAQLYEPVFKRLEKQSKS